MDTQATPDYARSRRARAAACIEQTKIGRFHGVQPSLLPQLVHPLAISTTPRSPSRSSTWRRRSAPTASCASSAPSSTAPDSRPLLVDIDIPTVVIVGRQDQVTPLPRAEEMAADIANSRLVVLEECGHMSPLEKPDEVTAALRRWLTE